MTDQYEITLERFSTLLFETLKIETTIVDGFLTFQIQRPSLASVIEIEPIQVETMEVTLAKVSELRVNDSEGIGAFSDHTAEFVIDTSEPGRLLPRREDLILADSSNNVTFQLGRPSFEFAILLLIRLAELPHRERQIMITPGRYRNPERRQESERASVGITELINDALRIRTLQIAAEKKLPDSQWHKLAQSFYFHVGYNLDYAIIPRLSISRIIQSTRIQRLRRAEPDELEAPRMVYITELVQSYQLALSAESPMLSYLSFYHVAEHWFEEIFLDDIAEKLKESIVSPGFSAKRKKDVRDLIKTVSKSLRTRDDQVSINEPTALRLTLEKYVDVDELTQSLQEFESDLISYYRHNHVSFAAPDTAVDLTSNDTPAVLTSLAKRIYQTRNSLVHRKDGNRGRFTPFKDDAALVPEVPLIRFVAEQIIIKSGDVA